MGPSTLASWVLLIARALRRYELDADAVFRAAQVVPGREPTARYPLAAVRRLWAAASQASNDPCFGLEVGRSWHVTAFHALGYVALASATLREALVRVSRYCRVVTTGARIRLVAEGDEAVLELASTPGGKGEPAYLEPAALAGLAALATLCREARGALIDPRRVLLVQQEKGSAARLGAFFRCPVRFEAPRNALVFGAEDLDASLETANPELAHVNEQAVARYLAARLSENVVERVRAEVLASLPAGKISQAIIARGLHMSVRTMQRRLKSEGVTFRDVVDSARRQLAREYAKDRTVTKEEVACLVGYAEPRSLARAVARWKARPDPLT